MVKVNRFPKMAVLQKYRAFKLGYPEDLVEAIGIAEALKYAIFKRIAQYGRKYKEEEEKKKKSQESLDWETFKTFGLAAYKGLPFVAGKVKTLERLQKRNLRKAGREDRKKDRGMGKEHNRAHSGGVSEGQAEVL